MIKNNKVITILVLCIGIVALFACLAGLFLKGGPGQYEFRSINGEIVDIYGSGLYRNDSVSVASQGRASDLVTLVFGIPILWISLYLTKKGSFRGQIMMTGTLGYFLYTYTSYTFLWMYNSFFIPYVILMGMSLYAFVLCFMSLNIKKIPLAFSDNLPVKFLGVFQIFIGFAIGLLWLGKIAPSVFASETPIGLEHYTTLVIQGMDLGIVVPTAFLSGILLIKRNSFGYLLSSVIVTKGVTMLTCISAMIVNQALNGVEMSLIETILFPAFNILAFICLFLLMKNVSNDANTILETEPTL